MLFDRTGWGLGPTFFLLAAQLLSAPVTAAADVFARSENQFVSEPEPLVTTIDKWGSDFGNGERQWAVSLFEVGVRHQGVEFSFQQRALADLRINASAAEFYSRIERELPLQTGENTLVDIRVNGFSAQALRLGYVFRTQKLSIGAGVSALYASHLMAGQLQGQFQATGPEQFSLEAQADYVYYRDVLFKRPDIEQASGHGRSVDLMIEWEPWEAWHFRAQAVDLAAQIRWDDAPFTTAVAKTNNKSYDEEGYAVINPAFSGRQGYRETLYQNVDPRYRFDAQYQHDLWSVHWAAQHQFGYSFTGIGAGYQLAGERFISAMVWPKLESLELALEHGKWRTAIAADHLLSPKIKAFTLNLSYGY